MRNQHQALKLPDIAQIDWVKTDGLVPAIIQDHRTKQVLMLAYMNEDALRETITTGRATFFSRSRRQLWRKGETSGAFLTDAQVYSDCDDDTLLVLVNPMGPACHLGTVSCFSAEVAPGIGWLMQLEKIIAQRRDAPVDDSYTKRLLDAGVSHIAQKVGEEGVEVALAGVSQSQADLMQESADLIYHLLVLLNIRDISLNQVLDVLRQRHNLGKAENGS